MTLLLFRTDPVEEIAAEQVTLDALILALNPAAPTAQASMKLRAALPRGIEGFGLPLVVDPRVPPGQVHFRPAPRPAAITRTEETPADTCPVCLCPLNVCTCLNAVFPTLTPTARQGDPRCGSQPSTEAPTCGVPAIWHVAWRLTPTAEMSLLCGEHMLAAQRDLAYADRHPAEVACDMPGTGWLLETPSRCIPISTDVLASPEAGEADGSAA